MRSAEGDAQARRADVRQRARRQLDRAVVTMRTASECDSNEMRVELAGRAVRELSHAFAISAHAPDAGHSPSEDDKALSALTALPGGERHAETVARLCEPAPAPVPARLEYDALARLFAWLEVRLDTRTLREVHLQRLLRCSILGAVVLLGVWAVFRPKNLALGRPVSASSRCDATPAPPLGKAPLYRVADGRKREPTFALCTNMEPRPWVKVDLGKSHQVDSVIVYPRSDCCFGEQDFPIVVELSSDDQHYDVVGTIGTPASVEFPWSFAIKRRTARYVRVAVDSKPQGHLVINEVEVYGS